MNLHLAISCKKNVYSFLNAFFILIFDIFRCWATFRISYCNKFAKLGLFGSLEGECDQKS